MLLSIGSLVLRHKRHAVPPLESGFRPLFDHCGFGFCLLVHSFIPFASLLSFGISCTIPFSLVCINSYRNTFGWTSELGAKIELTHALAYYT
jgi:hypothetical protein